MYPDAVELGHLVAACAREQLMPRFNASHTRWKNDGSVVTEADMAMQAALQTALAERWPDHELLGEEMSAAEQTAVMQGAGGFWCLDPLDGTSNFAAGIPFFSVSLALIEHGRPTVGVVYDPCRDELFTATRGRGAQLNGQPLAATIQVPSLAKAIGVVDFKRLPQALRRRLADHIPYSSQRSFGSVALDWCWIAAGRGHVYLHGKQKLWDYAAGWLILDEAGGHAVTLDGEAVFTPALAPRSAVAALDRGLFDEWTAYLGVDGAGAAL